MTERRWEKTTVKESWKIYWINEKTGRKGYWTGFTEAKYAHQYIESESIQDQGYRLVKITGTRTTTHRLTISTTEVIND